MHNEKRFLECNATFICATALANNARNISSSFVWEHSTDKRQMAMS